MKLENFESCDLESVNIEMIDSDSGDTSYIEFKMANKLLFD